MEEWQKWQLQSEAEIDQLQSELEDNMGDVILIAKKRPNSTAGILANLFLLQTFTSRMDSGEELRCGIPIDQFKKFLNG